MARDAGLPPTAAQGGRAIPAATTRLSSDELVALIAAVLEEGKAEDTVAIALAGKASFADAMVVSGAASSRQVAALAERLIERLKRAGHRPAGIEGLETGDWVLLDVGDVIVHIFRNEVRSYYNLEKMWALPGPGAVESGG